MSLAALAAPPAAHAQQEILRDYRQDGTIDPCAYSPGELQQGLENLPPDIEQYAPDLADQLRRGAACAAPVPAPAEAPAPAAQEPPAPVAAAPAAKPAPPKVPDPPAPTPQAAAQLAGAAPAAATVPTTRAAEEDLPTGILLAAALALAAAAAATRLRRT